MKIHKIYHTTLIFILILGVNLSMFMPQLVAEKTDSRMTLSPECSKLIKELGEDEATLLKSSQAAQAFKQKYKNTQNWKNLKTACSSENLSSCSSQSCGCGYWPKCEDCTASCIIFTCCWWYYCDGTCYKNDQKCHVFCSCAKACSGAYDEWMQCRKNCKNSAQK